MARAGPYKDMMTGAQPHCYLDITRAGIQQHLPIICSNLGAPLLHSNHSSRRASPSPY